MYEPQYSSNFLYQKKFVKNICVTYLRKAFLYKNEDIKAICKLY